jgi:hypothetical protein
MKKLASISLIVVLAVGLFWGCEKKENELAPALPPVASMSIDFSNFAAKKSAIAEVDVKGITVADKSNFIVAATTAGIWNAILAVNLAVPVESFKLAVNTTPIYLDNKKWEWSYDFNVIGATYKARLTGQIRTGDVKWEMYISKEGAGAFPELLWFEGTSNPDGKSGQWILNHSQPFPEPVLQIDWENAGSVNSKIKYTYIRDKKDDRSTDFFKTSFIEYGLTSNTLNAFYTIHQNSGVQSVFNDVFIEWSTTNHNGHIKANYHFKDDLWHCWNETGDNVICNLKWLKFRKAL